MEHVFSVSVSPSFRVHTLDVFMLRPVPIYKAILSILGDAVKPCQWF